MNIRGNIILRNPVGVKGHNVLSPSHIFDVHYTVSQGATLAIHYLCTLMWIVLAWALKIWGNGNIMQAFMGQPSGTKETVKFSAASLFPAHSGKVIFRSKHPVPRLTYYFTLLNNEVGFGLCRPRNMEVTDSRASGTGSVQLCYRACSERNLEMYWH